MNVPHPTVAQREIWQMAAILEKLVHLLFSNPGPARTRLLRRMGQSGMRQAFTDMAVDKSRFPQELIWISTLPRKRPGALTGMINYYRALVRHKRVTDAGDSRVDVPTLMIWGEEDMPRSTSTAPKERKHGCPIWSCTASRRVALGPAGSAGKGERDTGGLAGPGGLVQSSTSPAKTFPGLRIPFGSSAALIDAHQRDFLRSARQMEMVALVQADAVFGRD